MKKTIISLLIALVACSVLYLTFKREFDQFNPLYKEEYVYVVINKPAEAEFKHTGTRYRYNLTGYTEQGQKKTITFSSSKELDPNRYAEVLAKGAYTKKWTLIQEEEIPAYALSALSTQ
ncbi:YxeA family protein [Paenibacillus tepidiphilus]|uniref:YxeA family protein n=1 Tax=Paenibacillus tepidiphilus TaxID=2608683 RepID=UPI00123C1960|nr:YxeA family protein [Paenibacillus tepidiphilus]